MSETSDSMIEEVLAYMGVTKDSRADIAYEHWYKFLKLVKEHSGEDWEHVKNLARSYVNVTKRYIDEYLQSCRAWTTVTLKEGKVFFSGVPKGKIPPPKGRPFREYGPPPEPLEREETCV